MPRVSRFCALTIASLTALVACTSPAAIASGSATAAGTATGTMTATATGTTSAPGESSPTGAATPPPATPVKVPATPSPSPVAIAAAPAHYVFPVAGCAVNYGAYHHDYPATDILTRKGCRFVATTSGVVDEVSSKDTWNPATNIGAVRGGLSVSIVGDDGVRYYGSHLQAIAPGIRHGVRVKAGQLLGYVGNSGDARYVATHVHYGISWPTRAGIWWVRRGWISPYRYLNSWRAGGQLSPKAAVAAAHKAAGDVPRCRAEC
jgi:murein DD-endopeptidase MepM/ murein hydrolase activator NlpD